MLASVLANRFTPHEQRQFLQFCTGCPRLPLGGICALGAITVVRRSDAFASIPHDDTHFPITTTTTNTINDDNNEGNSPTLMKNDNSSSSNISRISSSNNNNASHTH